MFVCVIGPTQNKLRQARVETISTEVCNRKDVYDGLITPGMLCAGFMEGKVDACKVSPRQSSKLKREILLVVSKFGLYFTSQKKYIASLSPRPRFIQ